MSQVNVDEKLAVNKYFVDEEGAHIELSDPTEYEGDYVAEFVKLMQACPAGLYRIEDDGSLRFDYAGCLECGTCRMLCGDTILKTWRFPRGTFGVEYRFG